MRRRRSCELPLYSGSVGAAEVGFGSVFWGEPMSTRCAY